MTWRKWREAGMIRVLPALAATAALVIGVYLLEVAVPPARAHVARRAGVPLHFLPNHGQAPSKVRVMTRVPGLWASFLAGEVILRTGERTFGVTFDGASTESVIEGIGQQLGTANFFLGDRSDAWITDVPAYSGVAYRNLYSGIDLTYAESGGWLKSEFIVAPGASPDAIRLRYSGSAKLRVDDNGDLVSSTPSGEWREARPEIYQVADGVRSPISGGFRLLGDDAVGFDVEEYDRTRPLIIDPILSFSTYLGGTGMDSAKAIAVDPNGNAYVAGHTDSVNFPTKSAYRSSSGGGVDAFVAKLSVSGNSLVYCTYLGGGWDDRGFGIAVDSGGNAYVTGWIGSSNFPTTTGARQRVLAGGRDAFVAKLNTSGNALIFSTFVGGASNDSGNAIALNGAGEAHVAGDTYSGNFPVTGAFQSSSQGRQDAFAFKLTNDGSALVWSTHLGGYGDDRANAIAVDGSGHAYVAGGTDSSNFPTLAPLQGSIGGGQDAFVAKLSTDARSLIYSTYLGGSGGGVRASETVTGLQVDSPGNVYVTGTTNSSNFPVVNALQAAYRGGIVDAFVAKLNPAGSALLYSTYLGGSSVDYALGISVDRAGVACVTGSTDFPILNPIQPSNAGGYDVFVVKLAAPGNALVSASYWGGIESDPANALLMDPAGNVWITGQTLSTNFPVKNALQTLNTGGMSAFVAKWGEITPTAVFRATNGNTRLISYGASALHNADGYITTQSGISRNSTGDTFVTGLN